MDNLPNGGKVVIVDDCFQEILPLINILNRNVIPVTYYTGKADELPERPLQGVRLFFLDLRFSPNVDPKTIVSNACHILKEILGENNGPYLLIIWSSTGNEYKEELEKERISVENDKATVQAQLQAVAIKEMEVQKRETEVAEILEICNQIVSDEKNLNAKFLEFLDRESKRTGKRIRENVEKLYKRFQNERKKNVSDWQLELLRLRNERLKHGDTTTDYCPDIIDIADIGYNDLSA